MSIIEEFPNPLTEIESLPALDEVFIASRCKHIVGSEEARSFRLKQGLRKAPTQGPDLCPSCDMRDILGTLFVEHVCACIAREGMILCPPVTGYKYGFCRRFEDPVVAEYINNTVHRSRQHDLDLNTTLLELQDFGLRAITGWENTWDMSSTTKHPSSIPTRDLLQSHQRWVENPHRG